MARVKASTPKVAAHGSSPRPELQASVLQSAASDWARISELTTMATIITMAKTAM
ncbi:Uncharacterised protein [Mycobacteroides abscessus subsp. abscessus]|nr:Uncharacterised protein [Mycobacteroides abscessus subsp. abscessus]